ncbi:Protein of unknown function [Gryllus bimaculatus]|nr:Protein of unknown function [Gryllus bimaculatus]
MIHVAEIIKGGLFWPYTAGWLACAARSGPLVSRPSDPPGPRAARAQQVAGASAPHRAAPRSPAPHGMAAAQLLPRTRRSDGMRTPGASPRNAFGARVVNAVGRGGARRARALSSHACRPLGVWRPVTPPPSPPPRCLPQRASRHRSRWATPPLQQQPPPQPLQPPPERRRRSAVYASAAPQVSTGPSGPGPDAHHRRRTHEPGAPAAAARPPAGPPPHPAMCPMMPHVHSDPFYCSPFGSPYYRIATLDGKVEEEAAAASPAPTHRGRR